MSSTNWKNLGRKQGGNMKHNRNVKVDKAFYINGKWDTIYTPDNIKRLAYYNIDLPHVVGIGTNKPFSKFSFGDSSLSGNHVSGILTPGKVTAIAMHEKTINKSIDGSAEKEREGQDFTGFSYVTNLRSIRRVISNDDAKGIGIFANKGKVAEDTSLKTDKAVMYITDDNSVHIGGKPTHLNVIDKNTPLVLPSYTSENAETAPVVTGPNIMLDVSGSIHVNGFINFLKNGADTQTQQTDNPAGQLTYNSTTKKLEYASSAVGKTQRACPDGAIWVGWDKVDGAANLSSLPRLYIQRNGTNTRILTEFDTDLVQGGSGSSGGGLTWAGLTDDEATPAGKMAFYVFRQADSQPNNTLINTYIGKPGVSQNANNFTNTEGGTTVLPRLYKDGSTEEDTDPPPSALSVVGNLSVFDFTTGGKDGTYLDGTSSSGQTLNTYKRILQSDIYTKQDTSNENGAVDQKELGSIYMDRHLMIGGFKGDLTSAQNIEPKFQKYSSAIDISGGITQKPIMRVLTGSNNGSLVSNDKNCQDSIIIGNTAIADITGDIYKSFIYGDHTKIQDISNSLVQGNSNSVYNLTNSLVVGNNLIAGNDSATNGGATIDGLVALGVGDANLKVNGDDRIVLATKLPNAAAVKALVIDASGNVRISKNLEVEGEHVHLEVTELKIQDPTLELNVDGGGTATNFSGIGDNGGLVIKEHTGTVTEHRFTWYGDNGDAGEWRTYHAALSAGPGSLVGTPGIFKSNGNTDVTLKTGNTTTGEITITDGADGDISIAPHGTGKIKVGGTTPTITTDGAKDLKLDTNDGTDSGSITITDAANGDITIAPNGTGKIIVGGTTPTITPDGTADDGSDLIIEAQDASGNNSDGGDLILSGGAKNGNGKHGKVMIQGNTNPTIAAYGNSNLYLFSNNGDDLSNSTEPANIKIMKGIDGAIDIKPNGNGSVFIGGGGTSPTLQTVVNNDLRLRPGYNATQGYSSNKLIIYDDYAANSNPNITGNEGARFTQNNDKTVDLEISGKLTVDGLIDPTGLILDNNTLSANEIGNNKLGIYNDGGTLKFISKDADGNNTSSTLATVGSGTDDDGDSNTGNNTNASNKVKVSSKSNDQSYKVLFAAAAAGNNQPIFGDNDSFTFNPSSNTLTTTTFSGALSGTASKSSAFVGNVTSGQQHLLIQTANDTTGLFGNDATNSNYFLKAGTTPSWSALPFNTGYTTDSDNRNYSVQTDTNGGMYVNVPWSDTTIADTNTTYSVSSTTDSSVVKLRLTDNGGGVDDVSFVADSSLTVSESGDTITYGLANSITTENITLKKDSNRIITVGDETTGVGKDLNISAGDTSGNNQNGGNLKLSGGTPGTGGARGNIEIANNSKITSASGNELVIEPASVVEDDGNGSTAARSNVKISGGTGPVRLELNTTGSASQWAEIELVAGTNGSNHITFNKNLYFYDEKMTSGSGYMKIIHDNSTAGTSREVEIATAKFALTNISGTSPTGTDKKPLVINASGQVTIGEVSDTGGTYSDGDLASLHTEDATTGFPIGMIDHADDTGQDLTIKAQNAGGTNKAGGNLVLSGGDGTGTGSNGQVQVNSNLTMAGVNPTIASTTPSGGTAQPLRFKAADSNYTFMDGTSGTQNPIINTEASKDLSIQPGSSNILLGAANTTTDFTMKMTDHSTGAGKNLTIAAQKAGGTSDANGGNLNLSGGDKTGTGKLGNVNITGNNISSTHTDSANGTRFTINDDDGYSELLLSCSTTAATGGDADNHYNYISFTNQKLKIAAGATDADTVLTIEQSPKGTITLGEGTDTGIGTPTIRTARDNQNLVLEANGISLRGRVRNDTGDAGNPIIIYQGSVKTASNESSPSLAGGNIIVYSGRTESTSSTANQTQNDITSDSKFVIGSVDGSITNKTVDILEEFKYTLTIGFGNDGFVAEREYHLLIGEDVNSANATEITDDSLGGGGGTYVKIVVTINEEAAPGGGVSDEETWQVAKKLVDAINNNNYLQSLSFEAGFKSDGTTSEDDTEVYFYSRRDGGHLEYKNGSGTNAWITVGTGNNGGIFSGLGTGLTIVPPQKHLKITPDNIVHEDRPTDGNGNDFTIKAQSGKGYDSTGGDNDGNGYNGGDLILEAGSGKPKNGTVAGATDGTDGIVQVKSDIRLGASTISNDFTIKMTDSTSDTSTTQSLKIVGQKATQGSPSGTVSNFGDGGNVEITGGEAYTNSNMTTHGGNIILSAGSHVYAPNAQSNGGVGYRGMIHMKNYPIIQDYTMWNSTYSNLPSRSWQGGSGDVKYIKTDNLLGGFVRIQISGNETVYFPTDDEISEEFATATYLSGTNQSTATGFRCTICVLAGGHTTSNTYNITFKSDDSNMKIYDNTKLGHINGETGFQVSEGNSTDVLVQKNGSSTEWSVTRLN